MYESLHLSVTYGVTSYQAVSLPGATRVKFKQEILSYCIGNEKPHDTTFTVCMLLFSVVFEVRRNRV